MSTSPRHADLEFAAAREADFDALSDLLAHSFGFPRDEVGGWFARAGTENLRALRRGSAVCGALFEVPMAQFFGGRSVTMMGVAGVAVAPAERGQGAASYLMTSMLREARARGFAISTLYPATVSLYRRVGYERAGGRFAVSFDPRTCEIPRVPEMTVAEVSEAPDEIVALYRETARHAHGYLDRGPYVWSRVVKPRGRPTKTFTVSHAGVLEGYVVLAHTMGNDSASITITDLVATTSRAARAILRLLVEYRSLATSVTWHGGPSDLFTNTLPERHYEVRLTDHFMLRVVDVAAALAQRGWPRGATGSLSLELDDASLPETSGVYTLSLEAGVPTVVRGASDTPRVRITERGLASLYASHAPAHVLAAAGWLEADDDTRALLDGWFGAPYAVMRDFF